MRPIARPFVGTLHALLAVSSLALLAPGCSDDPAPAPPPASSGGSGGGGGSAGSAGTAAGGAAGAPTTACPAQTGTGTEHATGNLASDDEVWKAADGPHIVSFPPTVKAGQKLTIEPCAVVRLEKNIGMLVEGQLRAEGTAASPIVFERADEADAWGAIEVRSPGDARLTHTTLRGGGFLSGSLANTAQLDIRAGSSAGPQETLHADHLTIEGSSSIGIILRENGAFSKSSTDLTIKGSAGAPVRTWFRTAGSVPTGAYTGNASDEIAIDGLLATDVIREDMTLANRAVPYHVVALELRVGDETTRPTLTIAPGVTMRFDEGRALFIDAPTDAKPAAGILRAIGTKEAPIVLTSAKPVPAPGDWVGITMKGTPDPQTRIEHARIAFAGGSSGISSYDCAHPKKKSFSNDGALIIYGGQPASGFVANTAFEQSAGEGVVRGWTGDPVDFLATNTFSGIALCNQTFPKPVGTVCPDAPACPSN